MGSHSCSRRIAFHIWLPGLALLLALAGCSKFLGPQITVSWNSPKEGLVEGVPVIYDSLEVGTVTALQENGAGLLATVRLHRKHANLVRRDTTFFFHPAAEEREPFVEAIPLTPDSPPVKHGDHLKGVDSRTDLGVRLVLVHWPATVVAVGAALLLCLLLLLVLKALCRVWFIILCMGVGVVSMLTFAEPLTGFLGTHLPATIRPDYVAYVAAFFLGSLAASILLGLILRPTRKKE